MQAVDEVGGPEDCITLPLVSVIITNYNYARFLTGALNSVLKQSYPYIECIIVDDASTDNSSEVLNDIEQRYPTVKLLRKSVNAGQLAAFASGFALCSGEYVIFLDADDILFPLMVETHVFTHLSLRIPVGFSSSDIVETSGSRIVKVGNPAIANYVASGRGVRDDLCRRLDECAPDIWKGLSRMPKDIEKRLHFVDFVSSQEWVYAPTSGNCFRRDVLEMVLLDKLSRNGIKICADTYLNKAACLLTGAVLIDIPLSYYRIHGSNGFAEHPALYRIRNSDAVKGFAGGYYAWRMIVDNLIDEAALFYTKLGFVHYRDVLVCMNKDWFAKANYPGFEYLGQHVVKKLGAREETLQQLMGEAEFQELLDAVAPPPSPPAIPADAPSPSPSSFKQTLKALSYLALPFNARRQGKRRTLLAALKNR